MNEMAELIEPPRLRLIFGPDVRVEARPGEEAYAEERCSGDDGWAPCGRGAGSFVIESVSRCAEGLTVLELVVAAGGDAEKDNGF
jgi:hypothetical protein